MSVFPENTTCILYGCTTCIPGAHRGQRKWKASDPLELKLQMVVSHRVGVETRTQVLSARAAMLLGAKPSFQPFSWVFKVISLHISRRGRESNTGSLSRAILWFVLMMKLIYAFENLSKPGEASNSGHLSHCHSEISNTANILFIVFLLLVVKCFYLHTVVLSPCQVQRHNHLPSSSCVL